MEGSHVLHTDEDGNILLDQQGDQELNNRDAEMREVLEAFKRLGKQGSGYVSRDDPDVRFIVSKMLSIDDDV